MSRLGPGPRPSGSQLRARVLAAVARDWSALEVAGEALRADREVVLAAVAAGGKALQCAQPPRDWY